MIDEIDESLDVTPPDGAKHSDGGGAGGAAGSGGGRNEDLSQELARSLDRQVMEQVTCRRVGDHHYRCNWWTPESTSTYDNPSMQGSLVTTSRISQSQFLHATKTGEGLKFHVVTR